MNQYLSTVLNTAVSNSTEQTPSLEIHKRSADEALCWLRKLCPCLKEHTIVSQPQPTYSKYPPKSSLLCTAS